MAPPITCECGTCPKCKQREYMRRYYDANADKIRKQARQRRINRLEAARAEDRARGFRGKPLQSWARNTLNHAVKSGKLKRGLCEVCGTDKNIHGHHPDYNEPLKVIWLCRTHHAELHRTHA